jgi:hypothetical protein
MKAKVMNKFYVFRLMIIVLSLSIVGCVTKDKNVEADHLIAPGSTVYQPLTEPRMWEKIIHAADEYQRYAPVSRVGFSDITYAASVEEYNELDGYGLLVITVLSQKENELPVKRAYFRDKTRIIEFEKLYQRLFLVPDEYDNIIKVLGKYRADVLYVFPLYFRASEGELVIDFMENRDGFVISKFPLEKDDLPITPPSSKIVPMAEINKLIKREAPLFEDFIQ